MAGRAEQGSGIGSAATEWADLSFQQRYYWHLQEGGPNLDVLDGVLAFVLSGPLDVGALSRCVERLVSRHDSLRTRVSLSDDIPRQRWIEPYQCAREGIDLGGSLVGISESRDEAREMAEAMVSRKCQLNGGALFRVKILRISQLEHVVLLVIHHLISDYLSRMILLRELWGLYGALIAGATSFPSASEQTQFREYLSWQRETHQCWLQQYRMHWARYLDGATGLHWPTVSESVTGDRGVVSTASISFTSCLTDDLRRLAKRENTLLSIAVMATYIASVSRVCNQKEFVVGINTTGRDRMEHQATIGCLAHPILLRVRLTGKESFIDLLNLVNREYYNVLFSKDFGGVVMESPSLLSGTLFQWFPCIEGLKNGIPLEAEADKTLLEVEWLPIMPPFLLDAILTRRLSLMFIFSETRNSISGLALYRPRVFSPERLQEFFCKLTRVSERCVADPTCCMADEPC